MEKIKGHEIDGQTKCHWCFGASDLVRAWSVGRVVIPIAQSERPGCECGHCGWILDASGSIPKD
jgi:hypothetical protein